MDDMLAAQAATQGRELAREALALLEDGLSGIREGHALLVRAMATWPRLGYEVDDETLYVAHDRARLCAVALARVLDNNEVWRDVPPRGGE